MRRRITVLAADVSDNNLLRAFILARAIIDRYDVRIIGPQFRSSIWPPLSGQNEVEISGVRLDNPPLGYLKIPELYRLISGDLLIACKPLLQTLGVGLMWKKLKDRPLILDIDDWEKGFMGSNYAERSWTGRIRGWIYSAAFPFNRDSRVNVDISEILIRYADSITVSNRFLQSRYGGSLVYHCRLSREDVLKHPLEGNARASYGIRGDRKVVMFFGTPRRHKGLEVLIDAVKAIDDNRVALMVVGVDVNDPYCKEMLARGGEILGSAFIAHGFQPLDKVGEILMMADVVVIPQLAGDASRGQVPAKVFDAMAYAKPIIATACGDMEGILRGCGVLVDPGDAGSLAKALKRLLEDKREAEMLGALARERWKEAFCREAISSVMQELIERTLRG